MAPINIATSEPVEEDDPIWKLMPHFDATLPSVFVASNEPRPRDCAGGQRRIWLDYRPLPWANVGITATVRRG